MRTALVLRTSVNDSEDIFISKLHSSGVLRYTENNNDLDYQNRWIYTKKGPVPWWHLYTII